MKKIPPEGEVFLWVNMENERRLVTGNRSSEVVDPVCAINTFYSKFYLRDKEDSPDQSRVSLARKSMPIIARLSESDYVLDLGAGRQIFEREYQKSYGRADCQFVTIDIAQIRKRQLLSKSRNISHARASGTHLPFNDQSFSLVVSNMALDFMPEDTIGELFRVMRYGGVGLVNMHHPDLIPDDLDTKLSRSDLTERQRGIYEFWKYLRDNNVLYSDDFEIFDKFFLHGFNVKKIDKKNDSANSWWELELFKPTELSRYDVVGAASDVIQHKLYIERMNA